MSFSSSSVFLYLRSSLSVEDVFTEGKGGRFRLYDRDRVSQRSLNEKTLWEANQL